ncbi:MAG: hypothetical protein NT138_11260 [Planctomycetales bacterium]|nr:hypothetical protein [Planctomycetales bacterium]
MTEGSEPPVDAVEESPEPRDSELIARALLITELLVGTSFGDGDLVPSPFAVSSRPPATALWEAAPAWLGDCADATSGTSTTPEHAGQRTRFPAAVSGTFNVLLH